MNKYKFRVWIKEKNKFLSPFHLIFDEKGEPFKCINKLVVSDELEIYFKDEFEPQLYSPFFDCHDKQICEGDVLRKSLEYNDNEIEEVRFFSGSFCLGWQSANCISWNYREIIGNIHENPELLENK